MGKGEGGEDLNDETKIDKHPSYGMVGISHVSGHANLFGSEFKHQHYIVLTVRHAERHRDLSRDWYFGKDEIVSVALSESQFVELVGRSNIGFGTPCTIRHIQGKMVPPPPPPETNRDRFSADMERDIKKCTEDMRAAVATLNEAIETGKIGKTALREISKKFEYAAAAVDCGIPFVRKSFEEEMENVVNHAAVEIEATVSCIAMRLGIEEVKRIGATGPKLIESQEKADGL